MSEGIIGSVEADKKVKLDWRVNLFFTKNRLIIAKLLSGAEMMGSIMSDTASGAFGGGKEVMKKRREAYEEMSPEEIVSAHLENFALTYHEISRVEVKKPGLLGGTKIKVSTFDRTHEFTLREKKQLFDERVDFLRSILSDKVSVV